MSVAERIEMLPLSDLQGYATRHTTTRISLNELNY